MGLLDRAKRMMQGRSVPAPSRSQYYRVACVEGHILHGQRTDGYQALRCPTCGEGIFVLPRSPMPDPIAPASAAAHAGARPRPSTTRMSQDELVLADPPSAAEIAQARSEMAASEAEVEVEDEAQIEWVDEAEAEAPPAHKEYDPATSLEATPAEAATKPASPKSVGNPPHPMAKPAPSKPAPRAVPAGMIEVDERPGLKEWAWKRRNLLISLTVALLAIATIASRVRQGRLQELPKVAEIGRVQGLTQLDLGEFDAAKTLLAAASAAVDRLGGDVEGAESIRQGAREAAIFADLVDEPLEDLISKAAKYSPQDEWPSHFDAIYRGQSIIVQAQVVAAPDPARAGSGYEVDYQIYFGGGPKPRGKGRLDLAGFRLFEQAQTKVGEVPVFGARLASIRFDPGRNEWLVGLVPDSGVFITHDKALGVIGWPTAEAVEEPH